MPQKRLPEAKTPNPSAKLNILKVKSAWSDHLAVRPCPHPHFLYSRNKSLRRADFCYGGEKDIGDIEVVKWAVLIPRAVAGLMSRVDG